MVNKRFNQIVMTIEQVLAKRNAKFIGPFSFNQGVVKWSLSGSKISHTIKFHQLLVVLQNFEMF